MHKPTIIVIDRMNRNISREENPDRLALVYNCLTELGCEVIDEFTSLSQLCQPENLERLVQIELQECLVAIIIAQGEFDHDTEQKIAEVRKAEAYRTKIFVLVKSHNNEETIELGQHEQFTAYKNIDIYEAPFWLELQQLTESTKRSLELKAQEDNVALRQLQQAYDFNHNDDDMLSSQDGNTKSVVELMRLHLLEHPTLVKEEFDKAITGETRFCNFLDLEVIDEEVYQTELQLIANLDKKTREKLDNEVDRARGVEKDSGGTGVLVTRMTLGPDCYGFAYDPQTNGLIVDNTCGAHSLVKEFLADRISRIEAIKRRDFFAAVEEKRSYGYNRFISGLIVRTQSLQTPLFFIRTRNANLEHLDLAIQFFRRQRRFITVLNDYQLVPGQL